MTSYSSNFVEFSKFNLFTFSNILTSRGRVDGLSFFDYLGPFCFLLIEFHCTFSISYKFFYQIIFIIIVFRLGCDMPSELLLFVPAVLFSILMPLFCPSSSVSFFYFILAVPMRECKKILVHEFPVSYSHTEWYFLISLFGAREYKHARAREYKHAQRTLLEALFLK